MKPRIKVLIADDSEDDASLIMLELRRTFDATASRVDTEAGLITALSDTWDIIITDYAMPRLNGIEVIKHIRGSHIETPVIIVSGVIGEDRAVQAIKSGANDYILKDNLKRLVPTVERELKESEARLARLQAEGALKVSEAALLESEERFRQIFEQNSDAQILFEPAACAVVDVNRAALSLYGYARQEFMQGSATLLITGSECEEFKIRIRAVATDKAFNMERINSYRKDGTKLIISIVAQRIQLKRRDVIYCTVRDISEKIRLEEETALMQAKLVHANKMTALGTLASGIAHEINNPNNFILFNSAFLVRIWRDAEGILDQYQRTNGEFLLGGLTFSDARMSVPGLLDGIGEGARRVKRIVDELKDFARTDNSGLDEPFDVNKAVASSVAILKRQIEEHTDNFRITLCENLPDARGSSQRIEQVLINLIMNALDALQGQGRGVTVSTGRGKDAAEIVVRVTDEGQGIPVDLLPRITEPFFTTKSGTGGTGLGLSISYSIIKEHGGTIEFDSKEGAGTTVTVRLPVYQKSERQEGA